MVRIRRRAIARTPTTPATTSARTSSTGPIDDEPEVDAGAAASGVEVAASVTASAVAAGDPAPGVASAPFVGAGPDQPDGSGPAGAGCGPYSLGTVGAEVGEPARLELAEVLAQGAL